MQGFAPADEAPFDTLRAGFLFRQKCPTPFSPVCGLPPSRGQALRVPPPLSQIKVRQRSRFGTETPPHPRRGHTPDTAPHIRGRFILCTFRLPSERPCTIPLLSRDGLLMAFPHFLRFRYSLDPEAHRIINHGAKNKVAIVVAGGRDRDLSRHRPRL